jgi:hypothetical protein
MTHEGIVGIKLGHSLWVGHTDLSEMARVRLSVRGLRRISPQCGILLFPLGASSYGKSLLLPADQIKTGC